MESADYGYAIIGAAEGRRGNVFISGLEWQAGRLALIIPPRGPVRPGDFSPVWRTRDEAFAALSALECPDDGFEYFVTRAADAWLAGGPAAINRTLRGVDGYTIPDRPVYIFQADRKRPGGAESA